MSHSFSNPLPKHLSWRLLAAALAIVAIAFFGAWGMWQYESEHHHHVDLSSVVYHTLQLFILHAPHLEHPVNWQIHVGRLLAALIFFWALVKGLSILFQSELSLFWTRLRGGHVIICGLGRLGQQLTKEFSNGGNRVVVIKAQAEKLLDPLPGVILVQGDACQASQLRQAGLDRAKQLIAVCDDVQTNVAIVTIAGEVRSQSAIARRSGKLESWLFAPDPSLRQLLNSEMPFPHTGLGYQVNVRGLDDLVSLTARNAFEKSPLDFQHIGKDSPKIVHLVIVGFGPMGQRLALQAAHIGHFAVSRKPKITVLERDHPGNVENFLELYPNFVNLVDFKNPDFSHRNEDDTEQILSACGKHENELVTVALCWDSEGDIATDEREMFRRLEKDDAVNLKIALSMHRQFEEMPQTLIFQTRTSGFACLFSSRTNSDSWGSRLQVFGTFEETCSLEALMHESTDAVARCLHENWYQSQIDSGRENGFKPALWPWERLDEVYKVSNQYAADHIPIKLRSIGCIVKESVNDGSELQAFEDGEVNLMAQMEHRRWCAEWLLLGYSFAEGPRDDVLKTHPDLVPWDDLSDESKEYDKDQVRTIPKALKLKGMAIYRID